MEAYKRLVRRNKEYVNSLDSLANGITWLLPERFSESEIGPEAVTSIFGIITAINEHIIETTPTQMPESPAEPSSFPYSLCITSLKGSETLVELVAQQYYGDDKKWNFIAAMETIKVFVRLALFRSSGYKMLLHGGETLNVENSSDTSNFRNNHGENPLEGRALSALNRFGENARMFSEPTWLQRVRHQQAIMKPQAMEVEKPSLSAILSEKGVPGCLFLAGEVMFILRPLLYVLLIRKCSIKSWFPWFISLSIDLIGNGILSYITIYRHGGKDQQIHLSDTENGELKRRRLLWAFYLMRDPFFTKYIRQRLDHTQNILEPVPVIGHITGKLTELIIGAQARYTYMSGS